MKIKIFTELFRLLSMKAENESANGNIIHGVMSIPNALGGKKYPVIVTEASYSLCLTLTAYYPLVETAYLNALSKQGIARFNLSNMNSNRVMVITGGVDEREGCFYLYVTVDVPQVLKDREKLNNDLYGMMDALAECLKLDYGKSA